MPQLKALIVEDSPTMRQLLLFALKRIPGIVAREAADGVEGLQRCQEDPPDIILTDINMPVMDGLKFIERVRRTKGLEHTPIVVITIESGENDRRRALDLGADVFVTKPIQAPAIVRIVKSLLGVE